VSENVVLVYLMEKSKTVKSSTLWSTYSMLKLTLNIRDGIDVTKFLKLVPFLKKKSVVYQAKKSKVLTRDQINLFLEKASDENYLLWKWKCGINSVISKLMTFVENAETGQFLFLIVLILSCFTCS
jgi:hypothetical protein